MFTSRYFEVSHASDFYLNLGFAFSCLLWPYRAPDFFARFLWIFQAVVWLMIETLQQPMCIPWQHHLYNVCAGYKFGCSQCDLTLPNYFCPPGVRKNCLAAGNSLFTAELKFDNCSFCCKSWLLVFWGEGSVWVLQGSYFKVKGAALGLKKLSAACIGDR